MIGFRIPTTHFADQTARIAHHVLDVVGAQKCHVESRRNIESMKGQDPVLAALQALRRRQIFPPDKFQQLLKCLLPRLRALHPAQAVHPLHHLALMLPGKLPAQPALDMHQTLLLHRIRPEMPHRLGDRLAPVAD